MIEGIDGRIAIICVFVKAGRHGTWCTNRWIGLR